jgi:CubicO group peptidase (beta-lactamase class C family)
VATAQNATDATRPTVADWLTPDHRGWAFQHVRELVPSARVRRAANPRPLVEALTELDDLPVLGNGVTLDEYLRRSANGFLVLKSGTIRYERYLNGLRPDTPHLLMSVSKSIVASVAGVLVAAGSVDPGAGICDVLPELRGTAWEGCTVQHLLDMRSGVRFDESDSDPRSDLFVYEQIFQWRPLSQPLPMDIRRYMASLPADRPHGGEFRYQSILTDMLAWVLEAATGRRMADLLSELLWQPMGAESDAEITLDRYGNAHADGGISATLRDAARFGELWRRGGACGGAELIPQWWIQNTLLPRWATEGDRDVPSATGKDGEAGYYSQNWWIVDPARTVYAARGYCGQAIYVDTSAEMVVVLFSAWREHMEAHEQEVVEVVRALGTALS